MDISCLVLHRWCVFLSLRDEKEAKRDPGKVDKEQISKRKRGQRETWRMGVRTVVGNVLACGCSSYIHSYLADLSESWDIGATLRL